MSVAELTIDHLSYHHVLEDIHLQMTSGQMVAVVGPNGVGKSTLLKILSGLWRPTSGQVRWDGQVIHRMSAKERARQIAYIPQYWQEAIPFTVDEFVKMGRYAHREPTSVLLPELLFQLGLTQYADQPLMHLSGGERQRAILARCLYQGSEVILLDEPIANLDLFYQLEILSTLQTLAKSGRLIVLAIHHLELALQFCPTCLLLHDHEVAGFGATSEVMNEEMLEKVFQIPMKRYQDPFNHSLRLSYERGGKQA